jgi:lysine 2,3-aminomutase
MAIALTRDAGVDRPKRSRARSIARQFVPGTAETEVSPDELADPIGDEARSPVKASCTAI